MNLVPEDYKLEAEVQILNKDIGFVRPEQDVEIKIDSFPFTKYGTIKGQSPQHLRRCDTGRKARAGV